MRSPKLPPLSRRERQIMDILYRRGEATVSEVQESLGDQPNYSTVRAQLRVLEEKGHVNHEERGVRYTYSPVRPKEIVRSSALHHLVETFFEGSAEKTVAALLGGRISKISAEELDRISQMIEDARNFKGGEE